MAAPRGTVGELIETLNTLDHSAAVSILIDDIDVRRVRRNDGGIYRVLLIPDDSDGQVFLNLGRLRQVKELQD
jgi:hypothetical protein